MMDYPTCNGHSGAKISRVVLLEFKDPADKKKYDSMNDPHATYFQMQCLEEGKMNLIEVQLINKDNDI